MSFITRSEVSSREISMYLVGCPESSQGWAGSGVLMCHGGSGAEHGGMAEHVEAADQALGGVVLVNAVEVAGAEVGKRGSALQQGESGDLPVRRRWPQSSSAPTLLSLWPRNSHKAQQDAWPSSAAGSFGTTASSAQLAIRPGASHASRDGRSKTGAAAAWHPSTPPLKQTDKNRGHLPLGTAIVGGQRSQRILSNLQRHGSEIVAFPMDRHSVRQPGRSTACAAAEMSDDNASRRFQRRVSFRPG